MIVIGIFHSASPGIDPRGSEYLTPGLDGNSAHNALLQLGAYRLNLDAVDDVVRKRKRQQAPGGVERDAARLQVKQLRRIQLADGRAMGTLHVVGKDFELRLGIDGRVIRQQQYLVGLLGVGLLGVFANKDLAVETPWARSSRMPL
mgnify:CR=1 FL=1